MLELFLQKERKACRAEEEEEEEGAEGESGDEEGARINNHNDFLVMQQDTEEKEQTHTHNETLFTIDAPPGMAIPPGMQKAPNTQPSQPIQPLPPSPRTAFNTPYNKVTQGVKVAKSEEETKGRGGAEGFECYTLEPTLSRLQAFYACEGEG